MNTPSPLRTCRGCGCTDLHACPGGCAWVLLDVEIPTGICSACAEDMEWDPVVMGSAFCDAASDAIATAIERPLLLTGT
jgi:hypothetical protein